MKEKKKGVLYLQSLLNSVCPECGCGSEKVVKYFKKYKSKAYKEIRSLNGSHIEMCLNILLESKLNIFTVDYYELLKYAMNTDSFSVFVRTTARGIYELYQNKFDEIENKIVERKNKNGN